MLTEDNEKLCETVQRVMGDDIDRLVPLGALLCNCDPKYLSAMLKSTIATMVEANKLIIVERDP